MNARFHPDLYEFDLVVEYFKKRALQLLSHNYVLTRVEELSVGAIAYFTNLSTLKEFQSYYLYPEYRGKGIYQELYKGDKGNDSKTTILTSDDCDIVDFLVAKNIDHVCVPLMKNKYYSAISDFYGSRKAKRSGLDLMNHIDEGLEIHLKIQELFPVNDLQNISDAYTVHPIFQADPDLLNEYTFKKYVSDMDPIVVMLAMEYRKTANAYLPPRIINSIDEIELSPLEEVNQMLRIDKIQNRKDFEIHHKGKHQNSDGLDIYFKNWLEKLGITENIYQDIVKGLEIKPNIIRLIGSEQ